MPDFDHDLDLFDKFLTLCVHESAALTKKIIRTSEEKNPLIEKMANITERLQEVHTMLKQILRQEHINGQN